MRKIRILWTDDEIDILKAHIMFLREKGYDVVTATNGTDAIELVKDENFDLIFLDQNMPGISGLETLGEIKKIIPHVPIIMITKNEEEDLMDEAIGSKISDYLIKPINPNQILLFIKKHIDVKNLVATKTTSGYQSKFGEIGMKIASARSFNDWVDIYKQIVYWELELEKSGDNAIEEVFAMQKQEADSEFCKFIKRDYLNWLDPNNNEKPLLSHHVVKSKVAGHLKEPSETLFFIVIDNLRYDQWKIFEPYITEFFHVEDETAYSSILPTATQYSRNAIFSGLMPSNIQEIHPDMWLNDNEPGNKNDFEEDLLKIQLHRLGLKKKIHFEKIFDNKGGNNLVDKMADLLQNDLVVLVYNFVDMLSHANTELKMIKELASNDSAYRSLSQSWFKHSGLFELLKTIAEKNLKVVLTTDHGTIRVNKPIKVIGDRETSRNLRYKTGRNLSYNPKDVFEITKPKEALLPKSNVSSKYIFALGSQFIVYPKNLNHFINYYTNTYQHGGVSMEEMILPLVTLKSKLY